MNLPEYYQGFRVTPCKACVILDYQSAQGEWDPIVVIERHDRKIRIMTPHGPHTHEMAMHLSRALHAAVWLCNAYPVGVSEEGTFAKVTK